MVPFFGSKIPRRDSVFECDLATAHYALRPLAPSGNRAYRASAARQNKTKWFPDMTHDEFWGIIKQGMYEDDWTDSNGRQLSVKYPKSFDH